MNRSTGLVMVPMYIGMFALGTAHRGVCADDPAASTTSALRPGFRWIFNGKDLKGWHKNPQPIGHGTGGLWTVEAGAITGQQDPPGSGNGGILLSDEEFGDFEAIFEVRIDWGCDSGFFVRSTDKGQCYQVMIDYHDNGNIGEIYREGLDGATNRTYRLDGVYAEDGGRMLKEIKLTPLAVGNIKAPLTQEEFSKLWHMQGWNTLRVRVVGNPPTITTWLNGRRVTQYTSEKKFEGTLGDRGRLAVQVHGGAGLWPKGAKVRYRNIQVKELPSAPASQPATAPGGAASAESFVHPVDLQRLQAAYDGLSGRSRALRDPTKRSALKRRVVLSGTTRLAEGLIMFPGQTHEDTARAAEQVKLAASGGAIGLAVDEWTVWANLTGSPATLDAAGPGALARPSELPPRTAWATRAGRRLF